MNLIVPGRDFPRHGRDRLLIPLLNLIVPERDSNPHAIFRLGINGRFKKGQSADPNGRSPAGESIVEQFRDSPKAFGVIEKVIDVAAR